MWGSDLSPCACMVTSGMGDKGNKEINKRVGQRICQSRWVCDKSTTKASCISWRYYIWKSLKCSINKRVSKAIILAFQHCLWRSPSSMFSVLFGNHSNTVTQHENKKFHGESCKKWMPVVDTEKCSKWKGKWRALKCKYLQIYIIRSVKGCIKFITSVQSTGIA